MTPISYSRSLWAALFTFSGAGSVTFDGVKWLIQNGSHKQPIDNADILKVHPHRGIFWSTLELHATEKVYFFSGLTHDAVAHLCEVFSVAAISPRVIEALADWTKLLTRSRYLNHFAWSGWRQRYAPTYDIIQTTETKWLPAADYEDVRTFRNIFDQLEKKVVDFNKEYIESELQECKEFLNSVEEKPLTAWQRKAVITDEDNTLVVAGAGTGKTSVVIAKVAYLIKRLQVQPKDILLLAYNKAAAKEMEDRAIQRIGTQLSASTFHALGLHIISQVTGKKPSLSRLSDKSDEPQSFIEGILRRMLSLDHWRTILVCHLIEYLKPYRHPIDFPNKHTYIAWIKGADIKSMKGDQVRSHEECMIADWLYLNGIAYEYEHPYEHDVATKEHRQYKPDFYLTESKIYIEHFGVDRTGKTAPWINASKYREEMKWKRDTHHHYGTRLIETFSYERKEGVLTEKLAQKLKALGIDPKPKPPQEVERMIEERGTFSKLANLLATFLQHFKEARRTVAELRSPTCHRE